jgi:hypothetical protein
MAVLALRCPTDPLAHVAISQVDAGIRLFSQVSRFRARPTITSNLAWLLRIRQRLQDNLTPHDSTRIMGDPAHFDADDNDDVDLVGLQTRLVERAVNRTSGSIPPRTTGTDGLAGLAPGVTSFPVSQSVVNNGNGISGLESNATIAFTTPETAADHFVSL